MSIRILVTVGTTQFDELIAYTSSSPFVTLLSSIFPNNQVTYQIGQTGKIIPEGEHFRLSQSIHEVYDSHDIIITHGGAGTLLYFLSNPKAERKIIAVANDTLAGNHQVELVEKLDSEGSLLGFASVKEMRQNEEKVKTFLKARSVKFHERKKDCLLNRLVFGEE